MLLAKCAATRELALNLHHFFGIRKVLNQIFLEPVLCSLEILLIWPWDQSGCQKLGDHGTWMGRVFSERKDPPTYIILSLFTCYLQYQRRAFNTSQPVSENFWRAFHANTKTCCSSCSKLLSNKGSSILRLVDVIVLVATSAKKIPEGKPTKVNPHWSNTHGQN